MNNFLESVGAFLLAQGLGLTVILAMLGLVRTNNDHAGAFVSLCLISYTMIFVGHCLLKRVGAWPR